LAIRGGYQNISFESQHLLSGHEDISTRTQRAFPTTLNTQSSSTVHQQRQTEPPPPLASIIIDEEVSSYIIHEPAVRELDKDHQEVAIPVSDTPHVQDQESTDSYITTSPIEQPLLAISLGDHLPSFSRVDWPLVEEHNHHFFAENSLAISQYAPFNTTFTSLIQPNIHRARFFKILNAKWTPTDPSHFSEYGTVPLIINDAVAKNLRYFQNGITKRFQSYLDRFHHYKEVVEPIFREFGLPTELMYLSLVESGFNPRAFSRARASGPWQFMKATGRMYKLHVNWYVDERRDPIKSTVAAAHHLRDLYDRFGSWPLALAAYNAGSGKISRAIRKTGTRDYWKIRRTWYIRRETKDYVPRFIAATLIAQNPTAYGFSPPEGVQHEFDEVLIAKPVQLSAITKRTGISLEELKRLNPELRRNIVPRSKGLGYHLKVPMGMASLVAAHRSTFPIWTQPPPPPTQWYRIRRGDSLSVVARRFGMKVRQLKEMNNLSSNLIRVGRRLRVRTGVDDKIDRTATWYRVRYGDSLGRIANRFRISVRELKRFNNLSTNLIYPGDRLRVKEASVSQKSRTYRVRQGDSLWTIARQFRVSVRDLRTLNNLSSSIIRAGHMLIVSQ
jgi:membrane-bound lytic murein transglycosylase D